MNTKPLTTLARPVPWRRRAWMTRRTALATTLATLSALPPLSAVGAAGPTPAVAGPAPAPDDAARAAMVRLDALYIPLLSLTSAAQADAAAAPRARAAAARLAQAWPALHDALAAHPPAAAHAARWRAALQAAGRQMAQADAAVARNDWPAAHEALEPVRIGLMQVRREAGFEYAVDRLTAFHEPMEALVLAAGRGQAEGIAPLYAHAAALWREVERHPAEPAAYRLSPARQTQWRQGLAAEAQALSRLSDALRGGDGAALLSAAKAIKPPFARTFTAFGLAEGEAPW